MQKPFDVTTITDFAREPESKDEIGPARLISSVPKSQTEIDRGSFMVWCKDDISGVKVSFIEDEGYQILRISIEGRDALDMVLNHEQIRAFSSQFMLWITK